MSFSMTRGATETFNLTHAKHLASKVTTDMRRCQKLYGQPGDASINDYGTELALKLRDGYVSIYEFGWIRTADNERVLTWRYSVDASGSLSSDDRPGRILSGVNVAGCSFRNMMSHTRAWFQLSPEQRNAYEHSMPFRRVTADDYGSSLGTWQTDLSYSSTGVSVRRQTFKPYGI